MPESHRPCARVRPPRPGLWRRHRGATGAATITPSVADLALLVLVLVLALGLGGCTTLSVDSAGDARGKRTYVGIVTVWAPSDADDPLAAPRIRQMDISTLGLRLGNGVGMGYLRDRLLSIPLDCRLVVFIRSTADLAHAEKLLRATTQENLCSAQLSE